MLLADDAFASDAELREQLLHELAHQWLYLIEDIWPLDRPGAARLALPSGTRDRAPAEVLGAAGTLHECAALIQRWTDSITIPPVNTETLDEEINAWRQGEL